MSGQAEFSYEEDVERRVERPGDFKSDRHAAARQRQDNDVRASGVVAQARRQLLAGSTAIREAIERYRPAVGLHGHIHECRGMVRLGPTVCFNPGSEYGEGLLRGVLVNLQEGKVVAYQFTSG